MSEGFGNERHSFSLGFRFAVALIVLGVAIVVVAVVIAYQSFYNYELPEIRGATIEEAIISMMGALTEIAVRLGFLGIMVWAGGVLLKYGVQLMKS